MADGVKNVLGVTIEKIREMIDTDSIVGQPIVLSGGTTIIPISKVSFGFASGGSDLPTKTPKELFGGGGGAGVSIQPIAFIVIQADGEVKLMQMSMSASPTNAAFNMIPDVIDKISGIVKKDGKKEKKEPKDRDKKAELEETLNEFSEKE